MKFDRLTRILHALIAVGISVQLLLSLVMRSPRPGRVLTPLESFAYESHRWMGMAMLAVLTAHWTMFVAGHAHKGIGHFFPWLSRARLDEIAAEIRDLLRFRVADPAEKDSLSGAVEGIGLLAASLLAASGAPLFFGIADDGTMSGAVRAIREFHEFWGPVMWTYLCVHAGAVMLHVGLGHRSVLQIFRW